MERIESITPFERIKLLSVQLMLHVIFEKYTIPEMDEIEQILFEGNDYLECDLNKNDID